MSTYREQARVQPRPARSIEDIFDRPSDTLWLKPQDYCAVLKEARASIYVPAVMPTRDNVFTLCGKVVRLARPPR